MFQSTTAESIGHSGNSDPEPWRYINNASIRYAERPEHMPTKYYLAPRPEFDRPPVSRILTGFRHYSRVKDLRLPDALEFMKDMDQYWSDPAQLSHAHRVLSLLVAVAR